MSALHGLTQDEANRVRNMLRDYDRNKAVGRFLWRASVVLGGFAVGIVTIGQGLVSLGKTLGWWR